MDENKVRKVVKFALNRCGYPICILAWAANIETDILQRFLIDDEEISSDELERLKQALDLK